ncbi:MAG TPA: ABC-F family ATP-binding cassette domain-containing protein [Solirubrobacteraceae bacterium]|nr:ABC-F family ATP-binding cassette domain-containing protein [Solirubrobacteraceae bacterium]
MAVLIASDLSKDMAGSPLLRGVSFKLERRDRLTIAGRNGAGKTTLLRMLAGETSVDGGELSFEKGCKVALHDQRPPRHRELTLRDYILSGCGDLIAAEADLARLAQEMADGSQAALDAYARAEARLEHAGGWTWRDRATAMVRGLGFGDDDLDRRLETFSGGELTRASLARALAGDPDLLLLDEPTNHLDIESLEWLERTLVSLDAAIVLVAHDRWFLESVGTAVLELEAGRARFFPGTWTQWRKEQAARELALGRAIGKQQAEIARLERFVERFRAKATKARQAQSRVKRLEKIERIERDPRDREALKFQFKAPERSGRVVFELVGGRIEVGSDPPKVLLDDAEIWLERGEHVSLVGPNGAGKTTLIEALAGRHPLAAGRLSTGHNVKLGHLSQHADELSRGVGGDGFRARTVLEACSVHTGLPPNKARALLGRFLFSGEEADKPLDGLSGGERRRLSLAILVASGANVLVLDEPTNHLDLDSREALEDALLAFEGALLLVSHDRALLEAVGTRTVAVVDGTLRSYLGGWQEYLRAREEQRAAVRGPKAGRAAKAKPAGAAAPAPASAPARVPVSAPGRSPVSAPAPSPRAARRTAKRAPKPAPTGASCAGERLASTTAATVAGGADGNGDGQAAPLSKNARRRIRELEREIEQAEAALAALEAELADPAAWSTAERAADATERHAAARRAVEEAFARWEAAAS